LRISGATLVVLTVDMLQVMSVRRYAKLTTLVVPSLRPVARITGSHHVLRHPDARGTTVPVHQGRDIAKGTLRSILADTQLTIEELRQLL